MMMKYYKKYFDFIKEKDSKKVMWIRIQGYKIKGKAENSPKKNWVSSTQVAYLLGTDLTIIFFFLTFKRWRNKFSDFIVLDLDPH